MKPLILATILILSLNSYSQDTAKRQSREITKFLAEGLEAKQILIVRNKQLRSRDSTIEMLSKLDSLCQVKDSAQSKLIDALDKDNKVCNDEYNKMGRKLHRRDGIIKILLGIALIEGLLIFLK